MKTVLQELKEDLQESINGLPDTLKGINDLFVRKTVNDAVVIAYNVILKRIDSELLEEEKENIIDAYNSGWQHGFLVYGDSNSKTQSSEEYFNKTFKQE